MRINMIYMHEAHHDKVKFWQYNNDDDNNERRMTKNMQQKNYLMKISLVKFKFN